MHAFLSKIFGRKKDEKKDEETSPTALSPTQLLDGKFEAVSPTVSPSASKFLELDQANNERDKSSAGATRPTSSAGKSSKLDTLPHLSLNFGETRTDSFLLDDELQGLSDSLIGERRLNPLEALILIRSCSQAITAHGLETLGLMHPHWYSSSPEIQRKLISQFLHSQSIKNANDTTTTTFDSPIESTRSMHDIAAVLRWGLRHLQLDGDSFGTDASWYKTFLDAEAAAEYPPKAFSEKLAPMIPIAHLELLTTTLELFSSLAAHSEANSTSGSKLSKLFGIWLLTAHQIEEKDDWFSFYARWERTGRQLEHLFLARIRDTNEDERMPVRLLELVRKYPYTQGLSSPQTDLQLLPRPRFSTPIYDALFVRIEIEFPPSARKPKTKMHPLNLLADAFATKVTTGEYADLWSKITAASKNGDTPSPLSNIFADETIRFLSFIPDSNKGKEAKSPAFSLLQSPASPSARSSASVEADVQAATQASTSHKKFATEPITPLTASALGNNWEEFSSSGFLDSTPAIAPLVATLFDQDIEKTVPPEPSAALSRKSSRRVKAISRKSVDLSRTPPKDVAYFPAPTEAGPNEINPVVKAARLEIIQFDEAFIDFWTDSLLDPITAKWPTFIICKFKSTLVPDLTYGTPSDENQEQKQLKWLVLEQVYTNAKPPPPITLPTPDPTPTTSPVEQARAVSPTPSTRRRFNFWSMSRSTSSTSTGSANGKKKAPAGKVNEMGELVEEESAEQVKNKYVAQTTKGEPTKKVVGRVPVPTQEMKDSLTIPIAAAAAAVAATAVAATAIASDVETAATTGGDKTPTQEITSPVQEEVPPPQAATDTTVPVAEPVHPEADSQVEAHTAESISAPPAAGSEVAAAPTELASVAPEIHEPEISPPSAESMREGVVPTIEAEAVPLAVEPEVIPEVVEAAAASAEFMHTPAIETVSVVGAVPVVDETPLAPSDDAETASIPIVETEADIPIVEADQAEATSLVETEVIPTIEEPEVASAPVVEPANSPIVDAVSKVEAAPVIEKALPAPAIEAESAAAPIVETETATPILNTEETITVPTAGEEGAPANNSTKATGPAVETNDTLSVPEIQPTFHAVETPVVAPVEDETPTAPSVPEEAELEDPPVVEAETERITPAATVETDAPTSLIADIASLTVELDAVPPTAAAEQSINDVDTQTEDETDLSALEAAALTSVAAETTLSTIEATPADNVDISPAHAEVQAVPTEPIPVLAVNDGEATSIDPETEMAPAVEPEASSVDLAVEEETHVEPVSTVPGLISSPVESDVAAAVNDAAFVSAPESTIPPIVEAEGERSLSLETEAVVAPVVEAFIPHSIAEAEMTIPDVQVESSAAVLEPEFVQVADKVHVVPAVSDADDVPSDIIAEVSPALETELLPSVVAETGTPLPTVAVDSISPIVEEDPALEVVDTAAEPEGGEPTVQAEPPSVTIEDGEAPTAHQDVDGVVSVVKAELAVPVIGNKEAPAVDETIPDVAHSETEVIPHAVAEDDLILPAKGDIDVPPSIVEESVPSAIADEFVSPSQDDIPSVEQETPTPPAGSEVAAEPTQAISEADSISLINVQASPTILDVEDSPAAGVETAPYVAASESIVASSKIDDPAGSASDAHAPTVEPASLPLAEATEMDIVPPPVESVTLTEVSPIEAGSEVAQHAGLILAPMPDLEVAHVAAESMIVVPSVDSTSPGHAQAPISTDDVEAASELSPVHAEEKPIEHTHQEVAALDASGIEGPVSSPIVEAEHVGDAPLALTRDHDVIASHESTSTAVDQADAFPQPQIEEDRSAVVDELAISSQAGASEQFISAESIVDPVSDASALADEDVKELQAHPVVAEPKDVEEKEEQLAEAPVSETVLEQVVHPASAEFATEDAVEVNASDPVLPPGLYPTPAQVLPEAFPVSEVVLSAGRVEPVALAADSQEGAVVPPKTEEHSEGGATDDQHTSEIRSATPTNELSARESATATGESISAISPPSTSPNESFAPTVIAQEAPVLDVTTAALNDPVSALSTEASLDTTETTLTVTIPTKDDDADPATIADAPLSPPVGINLADGADAQTERAANLEHSATSAFESREARTGDFAGVIAPSASLVDSALSEPEVVTDTAEKDESILADSTLVEPAILLSDEHVTKSAENVEAENVSDSVVALATPSEPGAEENEQSIETAAALAAHLPEELIDVPAESNSLDTSPAAIIPTEADTISEIVAPLPATDIDEAGPGPAAEIKDKPTAGAETTTALTKQQDAAQHVEPQQSVAPEDVVGEVSAPTIPATESQPPAKHEIKLIAEVAASESGEAGTELASAFADAPTGEESIALQSEQEVIQGSAVADAALDIPLNEAPAHAPLTYESMFDAQVEEPVAAAIAEPGAPIESSESSFPEEELVAAPEPAIVTKEPLLDAAHRQIIDTTTEPVETKVASEGPAAPSDLESEVEPVVPSEAPVVSTEMIAETSTETSHIIEETEQAPEVDAHIAEPASAEDPLVENSVIDVPSPAAPPMVEAEAEHAPEASELVASVETAGPAVLVAEASRNIVEETPIVKDATSVVESSESPADVEPDVPAVISPAPVVDEASPTDEKIHAAVEEPVHSESILHSSTEEPAPPLENAATAVAPAVVEDVETTVKLAAVRIEPSVDAELSVEEANDVEAVEAKSVEYATEGPAEPVESVTPVDESIAPVEPAPAEELPNVQVVEVGLLSTEQTASSPADVEVAAEAETIHSPPADTDVGDGNAHSFSSAEPEAAPADAVVEALFEKSAQEPDALLATSASEVLPTQEEVSAVEESATPTEDVTRPSEPSPETVQEPVLAEEPAEVVEGNTDQLSAAAAAEPDEYENVPPAIHNDSSQSSESIFSESFATEHTDLDGEPVEMSTAPIEPIAISGDIPASEETVRDNVEVERAVEHEDSKVPEEATEQEDEAVGAPVQGAEVSPVEDVFAAPALSSNVIEPEAEATTVSEPVVEHDLSDEPVAKDPPVTENALVVAAAAAEDSSKELAQETPAPEGIPVHEDSTDVEETPMFAEPSSPATDSSAEKEPVEAASNPEVDSIATQQDTDAIREAVAHSDESTLPVDSSPNVDRATMINESVIQEEAAPIEISPEKVEIPAVKEPSIAEEVVTQSDAKSIDVLNDSVAEQVPSEESAHEVGPESIAEAEKEKSDSAESTVAEAETVEHIAQTESTFDVPENDEDRAVLADSAEPDVEEVRVHTDAIIESAEVATPEPPLQPAQDELDLVQVVDAHVEENDVQPSEEAETISTTEDIPTHAPEDLSEQPIVAEAYVEGVELTAEVDATLPTPAAHHIETEETAPLTDSISEAPQAEIESAIEPDHKVASTSHAETPSSEEDSQLPIVDASPQVPGHDEPTALAHAAVAEPSASEIVEESVEEVTLQDISFEETIEEAVAVPALEVPAPSAENVVEEAAEQPLAEDVTRSAPTANGESVDITATNSLEQVDEDIEVHRATPAPVENDNSAQSAAALLEDDIAPVEHLSIPEVEVTTTEHAEEAKQDEDAAEQHEPAATAEPEAHLSEEAAHAPVGPETAAIAEEEVAPKDRDNVSEAAPVTTEYVPEAETVDAGIAADAEVGAAEAADTPSFDKETQNSAVDEPVIADKADVDMDDTAVLALSALSEEEEAVTEAAVPTTPTVEEEQVEHTEAASKLEVANAAPAEVTEAPVRAEIPTEAAETPVDLEKQSIVVQEDVAPSTKAGEVSLDPAATAEPEPEQEEEQPIIQPPALETTAEPTEVQAPPADAAAIEAPPEVTEHLAAHTEAGVESTAAPVVDDSILPAEAAVILDYTSELTINDPDTTAAAESDQVEESTTHEPVSAKVVPATAEPAAASEETAIHPIAAPAMQDEEVGPVESTSVSEGVQEVVAESGEAPTGDQASNESTQGQTVPVDESALTSAEMSDIHHEAAESPVVAEPQAQIAQRPILESSLVEATEESVAPTEEEHIQAPSDNENAEAASTPEPPAPELVEVLHADTNEQEPHFLSEEHRETHENIEPALVTEVSEPADEQLAEHSLSEASAAEALASGDVAIPAEAAESTLAQEDEEAPEPALATESEVALEAVPPPDEAEADVEGEPVVEPTVISVAQERGSTTSQDVAPLADPEVDEVPESAAVADTADPIQQEPEPEPVAASDIDKEVIAASEALGPQAALEGEGQGTIIAASVTEGLSPEVASAAGPELQEIVVPVPEEAVKELHEPTSAFPVNSDGVIQAASLSDNTDLEATTAPSEEASVLSTYVEELARDSPAAAESSTPKPDEAQVADETEQDVLHKSMEDGTAAHEEPTAASPVEESVDVPVVVAVAESEAAVELSELSTSVQEPVAPTEPVLPSDEAPVDNSSVHVTAEAETTTVDAPTREDSSSTKQVEEVTAAAEDVDRPAIAEEPSVDDSVVDISAHDPVVVAPAAASEHDPEPAEPAAVVEVPVEFVATASVDEFPQETPAIGEDIAKHESIEAEPETPADLPSTHILDSPSLLDEQDATTAEETIHPSATLDLIEDVAAPHQNATTTDVPAFADDTEASMEAAALPVDQTLENGNQPGVAEEELVEKTSIDAPVAEPVVDSTEVPEAETEPENLANESDVRIASEEHDASMEPAPETESAEDGAANILVQEADATPAVDIVASGEVEPEVQAEAVPEATPNGDFTVDTPQVSDVLIGNGNGHHPESDKPDASQDKSESVVLPNNQDVLDEESPLEATATANGNGHVKTETDATLVEPTAVPSVEDGELEKAVSQVDEVKPVTTHVPAVQNPAIQDDSVLPTESVLTKVEELLATAGSALDMESIAKFLPLATTTHDDPDTKLTTTAVNDGDEEQ